MRVARKPGGTRSQVCDLDNFSWRTYDHDSDREKLGKVLAVDTCDLLLYDLLHYAAM